MADLSANEVDESEGLVPGLMEVLGDGLCPTLAQRKAQVLRAHRRDLLDDSRRSRRLPILVDGLDTTRSRR